MSDTSLTQRLDAFREFVNLEIALGRFADVPLPVVGDDGSFPVVAALREEPLRVLLARVRARGGYANVFVDHVESDVILIAFIDVACALDPDAAEDLTGVDVPHWDSEVGAFVDYLAVKPKGVRVPSSLTRPAIVGGRALARV